MPKKLHLEKNSKKGNHAVWRKFTYLSLFWLLAFQLTGAFKTSCAAVEKSPSQALERWEIDGIMAALDDPDARIWVEALTQLSRYELDELKKAATNSIDLSKLAELLEYKESIAVSTSAANALGKMGELAKDRAPALVELLEDSDWRVRQAAAQALFKMGQAAKDQVPKLGKLLSHPNSNIRWVAAEAMGGMGPSAREQAPKLVEMLKDSDWRCRSAAAKALAGMEEAAKEQAPKLLELLKDPDWRVRRAAAEALAGMNKVAIEQAPKLGALLKDSDWRVKRAAAEVLGGMGEAAAGQATQLEKLLKDADSSVRRAAAEALGQIGPKAKEQAPKLVERLEDPDSSVRWAAARALGHMGEAAAAEAPKLGRLLSSPNSSVRWAAAQALGHMGEAAKTEAPKLVKILKDSDWSVKIAAAEALGSMGASAKTEAPELLKMLSDPDTNVRLVAARALGKMEEVTKAPSPLAAKLLKDPDNNVRKTAAEMIGRMGPLAKKYAPALAGLLKDSDKNVQRSAAQALGQMGEAAKEQAAKLAHLLKDSDNDVKRAAARALGDMGKSSQKYAPQLVELLKDPNRDVRLAAADALKNMGPVRDIKITSRILGAIYQYPSETATFRFLIYFLSGAEPNSVTLLEWLASPKKYPQQLSDREGVEALNTFAKAWGPSESFLGLRKDLENQIAAVIEQTNWKPENRALLEQHYRNFKSIDSRYAGEIARLLTTLDRQQRLSIASQFLLSHLLLWVLLFFAYPKSVRVRSIFFWNPWVRRIVGLGYIDALLLELPWLRSRLFAPFHSTLVAEADLESFEPLVYFDRSRVKIESTGRVVLLKDAIPKLQGQIILQGESGFGKSMFLRYLAKNSRKAMVYLQANECKWGVSEAIQDKMPATLKYSDFFRRAIEKGGIDIYLDGLDRVNPNTRARIAEFLESDFKGNIIIATQKLEWQLPVRGRVYTIQPLAREEMEEFFFSRQAILPADAPVRGEDYQKACKDYLFEVLNEPSQAELKVAKLILSNPMSANAIALAIGADRKPDLFYWQKQQYQQMAKDYQKLYFREFPLSHFDERAYQMRLDDESTIEDGEFIDELQCMERHQMVVCHRALDGEGNEVQTWKFCHEKIMDYFVAQNFLKQELDRIAQHFEDSRFRGVYLLLANLMPFNAAMELRERLIQYAADTKDDSVSNTFVQILRSRKSFDGNGSKILRGEQRPCAAN